MPTERIVTSDCEVEPFMGPCMHSLAQYWGGPVAGYTDEDARDIPFWSEVGARLPVLGPASAEKPRNYIWNAARYAVKCFVWCEYAENWPHDVVVWLDADTYATQPIPSGFFAGLLGDADVAYLGRRDMHPETGCVIFRLPQALPLIHWCRDAYLFGWYRDLADGWTDCHVFRAGLTANPQVKARDLTSHLHDGPWNSKVDAFALSPLGPYLVHLKGSKRKREALCAT